MPKISIKDNKNNRWKRNAEKKNPKTEKNKWDKSYSERVRNNIRLDLVLSMSLWKEFHLLQILNDLFTKHLIKLILHENDVKLLKLKRRPV